MAEQVMGYEFQPFPKIARLAREIIVTEKIDGTNAQVAVELLGAPNVAPLHAVCTIRYQEADWAVFAGSRSRWLKPGKDADNFGFAAWVHGNAPQLVEGLGAGRHYGEWWGPGIQRGYGLKDRQLSLFNTTRWCGPDSTLPACCSTVPVLYRGVFDTGTIDSVVRRLGQYGSLASPGFMRPEGVVIYHVAGNHLFKMTLEDDDVPKEAVMRLHKQEMEGMMAA